MPAWLALLATAAAAGREHPLPHRAPASLPARVDALFARWNRPTTPGCAVEVAEGGRPVLIRYYGSADLEHRVPIGPATVFEAGSVAKQVTAAAVLLLAEEGRLGLDDDVRRWVPELPAYPEPVRIRHLLSHTAGLRDWGTVAALAGWPRGTAAYDQDDVLAIIARQRALNFPPGSEYSYSNSGYNLLAIVVQRASGRSLAKFTAERFFKPLGMTNTGWRDDFRRIVPGRAIAYAAKGVIYQQDMPFENGYGNGGLLTTAADLTRWTEALLDGRLGRTVAAELQRRATLNDGTPIAYGRGLFVTTYAGLPEISHAGVTEGYHAWLAAYPSRRLTVALLCNTADADAPALGHAIANLYLGPTPAPKPEPRPPLAARNNDWDGLYLDAHDQPLAITSSGGQLGVVGGGLLFPLAADRFRLGDDRELSLASPGIVSLQGPDGAVRYRRVTPAQTGVPLASYDGRYESEEVGATYRVIADGKELRVRLESRPQVEFRARPVGVDLFQAPGAIIRFRRGEGRVTGFAISVPRAFDVRFTRL